MKKERRPLPIIGWREWLGLPDLGIEKTKAKIDTGARSSTLHAFDIEIFKDRGQPKVRFRVHPLQHNSHTTVSAEADLLEERNVKSSVGHIQRRPVIITQVRLGDIQWPIELTLTNRDVMGFRMLLGRQAIRRRFLVDAGHSYLQSATAKS